MASNILKALAIALLAAAPAFAQRPPQPMGGIVLGGVTRLSVSDTTNSVALPSSTITFPFATIIREDGSAELFYRAGGAAVEATVADFPFPAFSHCVSFWIGNATTIAAIATPGGSATIAVMQSNGPACGLAYK
jgi:hypothetical protein